MDELLTLDALRLSARWSRWLVRALAGDADPPAAGLRNHRRAFAFADDLISFHDQVTRSSSANVRLLLERLCFHWRLLAQSR